MGPVFVCNGGIFLNVRHCNREPWHLHGQRKVFGKMFSVLNSLLSPLWGTLLFLSCPNEVRTWTLMWVWWLYCRHLHPLLFTDNLSIATHHRIRILADSMWRWVILNKMHFILCLCVLRTTLKRADQKDRGLLGSLLLGLAIADIWRFNFKQFLLQASIQLNLLMTAYTNGTSNWGRK